MTAVDPSLASPGAAPRQGSPFAEKAPTWLDRVEKVLDAASERLNPILVKEARQALKSRQFAVTFTLVQIFGWGWSILGTAIQSPGIYYAPAGPFMLYGYYMILAFPLLVIVPFSAFRSLAAEWEDGTYDLLSITTLAPRQIIGGKLASAILQMIVHLSALSPCVAFTYLLRGIDIVTILLVLVTTVLGSIALSVLGLLLATVTRARHWQAALSVLAIVGLLLVYAFSCGAANQFLYLSGNIMLDEADFWIGVAALLSGYASYLALFFLAAAARITFASDNRSTRLRVAMLVQHLLLIGWMTWFWLTAFEKDVQLFFTSVLAIHWFLMGALMTGEGSDLSPRVRRQLPASLLGRMLLTWFNPGPATGYVFAVTNLLAGLLIAAGQMAASDRFKHTGPFEEGPYVFVWLLFVYVAAYLGVGRLIMLGIGRLAQGGVLLSLLVQVLLAVLGVSIPWTIQLSLVGVLDFRFEYSLFQATNWIWTLFETVDGDIFFDYFMVGKFRVPLVAFIVTLGALGVILINLLLAARDSAADRTALPERVKEDDKALRPVLAQAAQRTSPWDDPA